MRCPVCGGLAKRRSAYRSQGVIFKGLGFTKTVVPPLPPKPTTIPGEPTEDWLEKTDDFIKKQHHDDEEYRPERKKQLGNMIEQADRGGLA